MGHSVGYVIRRISSPQQVIIEQAEPVIHTIEFGAMSCNLTGALNRIGLRKCFDQLVPSDLKNLSVIFLNIDNFADIQVKYG